MWFCPFTVIIAEKPTGVKFDPKRLNANESVIIVIRGLIEPEKTVILKCKIYFTGEVQMLYKLILINPQ